MFENLRKTLFHLLAPAALLAACGGIDSESEGGKVEQTFSSEQATLLDFAFEGRISSARNWGLERLIEDQLLYSVGQLNGHRAVGRLDRLEISDIELIGTEDSVSEFRYHAVLPVAWGSKTRLPDEFELVLPRRVDYQGLEHFTESYSETCVDWSAHDVTPGSMWYYYRPDRSRCDLAEGDIVRAQASVSLSPENTTGKYPEYHRIWEDDELIVVAIFGKDDADSESNSDVGIRAYNQFVGAVHRELGRSASTIPEGLPSNPGAAVPDVTISRQLDDGRMITVHALLVDGVRVAGPEFDRRYEALSVEADLIAYNGHAGLGANIRAIARKGRFRTGKYQIFFINGCDTFAYIDGALAQTRAALNPDDPSGTKYMDIITNAMPAFFSELTRSDLALIRGLMRVDQPMTYEAMFANIDRSQIVVVTGEEDNVYEPDLGEEPWSGLHDEGVVTRGQELRYQTPELPRGAYVFTLSGDADADLYVRVGAGVSTQGWDCRPYQASSNEICRMQLDEPAVVHVMVRGYAASSSFSVNGATDR